MNERALEARTSRSDWFRRELTARPRSGGVSTRLMKAPAQRNAGPSERVDGLEHRQHATDGQLIFLGWIRCKERDYEF